MRRSWKRSGRPAASGWLLLAAVSGLAALAPAAAPGQEALDRLEQELREQDAPPGRAGSAAKPAYFGAVADDRQDQGRGVRIVAIDENSPAAAAGLQENDLITSLDGRKVRQIDDLAAVLEGAAPGDELRLRVERGGRPLELRVTLAERPPPEQRRLPEFGRIPEEGELPAPQAQDGGRPRPRLGVVARRVGAEDQARLSLPSRNAALVEELVVGSPADKAGLPLGAAIVSVNGTPVDSPDALARSLDQAAPGEELTLGYYYRGKLRRLTVRLDQAAPGPAPGDAESELPPPPQDGEVPPPPEAPASSDRLDALEQRLRNLERRVAELEKELREAAGEN